MSTNRNFSQQKTQLVRCKEKSTRQKVKMRKRKPFNSKRSSFSRKAFKTTKRKRVITLTSWRKRKKTTNSGQEKCSRSMNSKSSSSIASWRKSRKSYKKVSSNTKILSKNIHLRNSNGKKDRKVSKTTWQWARVNITRCKRPLNNLRTKIRMKLRSYSSNCKMLKKPIDREKRS